MVGRALRKLQVKIKIRLYGVFVCWLVGLFVCFPVKETAIDIDETVQRKVLCAELHVW